MNPSDRYKSLEALRAEYAHLREKMDQMNGDEFRFSDVAGRITEIEQEFNRRKNCRKSA